MVDHFFDLVEGGLVKVRVMFTQNIHVPRNLTAEHVEDAFFILYYQFIKHGFGLIHCPPSEMPINLRIYLDRLPDTKEKADRFKAFLCSLTQNPDFRRTRAAQGAR